MLEYARNFGLNTVVFRHSTIYGGRQISSFDQGWIGWFCQKALDSLEDPATSFTINGNGKQVRDLLHVFDAVACYLSAHKHVDKARGQTFNRAAAMKTLCRCSSYSFIWKRSLD